MQKTSKRGNAAEDATSMGPDVASESLVVSAFTKRVDRMLLDMKRELETLVTERSEVILDQVSESHDIIAQGINHTNEIVGNGWMDIKYITKHATVYTTGLFPECTFTTPDGIDDLRSFLEATIVETYAKDVPGLKISPYLMTCYDVHECDMKRRVVGKIQEKEKLLMVAACTRHHYEIENLSLVSVLFRARYLVPAKKSDTTNNSSEMFIYLLGKGMF